MTPSMLRHVIPMLTAIFLLPGYSSGVGAATASDNYGFYCVPCHGKAGTGKGINAIPDALAVSPRDHTNGAEMGKLRDADLAKAIRDGGDAVAKSELMPPWRGVLTEAEIADLVVYLRTLCQCRHRP